MTRSDAEAAMLCGKVQFRRQCPLHDEALDPAARAFLEEASAPVAHDEIVADIGVRDSCDRGLVVDAAAQAALVRRAPLRVAPGAHERASRAALAQRDVRKPAAAR